MCKTLDGQSSATGAGAKSLHRSKSDLHDLGSQATISVVMISQSFQQTTTCNAVLAVPLHNFAISKMPTRQTVKECSVPNHGHSLLGPPRQPCRKLCDARRQHIVRFYGNATAILGAIVPPAFVEMTEIQHWKFDCECIWVASDITTIPEPLPMQRGRDDAGLFWIEQAETCFYGSRQRRDDNQINAKSLCSFPRGHDLISAFRSQACIVMKGVNTRSIK